MPKYSDNETCIGCKHLIDSWCGAGCSHDGNRKYSPVDNSYILKYDGEHYISQTCGRAFYEVKPKSFINKIITFIRNI